jgi:hypothetical protein
MRAATLSWTTRSGWEAVMPVAGSETLVFYFGPRDRLQQDDRWLTNLRATFGGERAA